MTPSTNSEALSVDDLAQEIRSLAWREMGAGLLAEKLMPFFERALSRRSANSGLGGVKALTPANFEHEVTQQTQAYEFKEGPNGEWLFRCPEWFDLSAVLDVFASLHPTEGAEPVADFYALHSPTRAHIGLWPKKEDAYLVAKEYEGCTITPLYTRSSPVSAEVTECLDLLKEALRLAEYGHAERVISDLETILAGGTV
jgi:hypothetical protein